MKRKLTKRTIDALKGAERPVFVWDTEVTGFGVKVLVSGAKSFVFQYRVPGAGRADNARRITLGRYGDLTVEHAKRIAASMLLEVKAGGDPAAKRQTAKSPTVAELCERFLVEYLPSKKRPPTQSTVRNYDSSIRCHIVPKLGKKKVNTIKLQDIERLHQSLRQKPYTANRMLSVLQQAFDQAEAWGWREQHTNPVVHVDRYPEERRGAKKDVMLSPDQMAALLDAIEQYEQDGGDPYSCGAIRLAFWTGWRIGEVLSLQWKHVDLETGIAKLTHTKTEAEEYRQLPDEAIRVLESLDEVVGNPYVFPGIGTTGHITTVKKAWQRVRKDAELDSLEGLGALRLHDLRHNVVSWDVSRGASLEVAGKNVGHKSRQATEIYAHFAPNALKRAANERASAMREAVNKSRQSPP